MEQGSVQTTSRGVTIQPEMAQVLVTADETAKAVQHQIEAETHTETSQLAVPSRRHEDVPASDESATDEKTIFYLAYGSNLAAETFQGKRGIRPLSAVNVVVPSLRLAFDLPGIAYSEPCFANSAVREGYKTPQDKGSKTSNQSTSPPDHTPPYHKDRWSKGMVGVAYELTPKDYAHVIETEGAGASYQDIVVDCYVMPKGSDVVPTQPDGKPLKVHTLFAPRRDGALRRPDPAYAQPSARYLKLLTDGASENQLPLEYREYLGQIRPYRITTKWQQMGQYTFRALWVPILMFLFTLFRMFSDKKGKAPPWLARLSSAVFMGAWTSYDTVFKPLFGDGERTIGETALRRSADDEHPQPDQPSPDEKELLLERVE